MNCIIGKILISEIFLGEVSVDLEGGYCFPTNLGGVLPPLLFFGGGITPMYLGYN